MQQDKLPNGGEFSTEPHSSLGEESQSLLQPSKHGATKKFGLDFEQSGEYGSNTHGDNQEEFQEDNRNNRIKLPGGQFIGKLR